MNCLSCGAENSSEAAFCTACGVNLAPVGINQGMQPTPPSFPQPYPAQPYPAQPYPPRSPYAMPPQLFYPAQRTDGLCIAGMVLGIIGVVLFWFPFVCQVCAVLAIVFSAIGIKNVQHDPGLKAGYGMGVAGLVTGGVALIGGTIFLILVAAASN